MGTWSNVFDGTTWSVTIAADGTFTVTEARDDYAEVISGAGSIDLTNYFINLTALTTQFGDAEPKQYEEGVGRAAFAPAHNGKIRMSPPWHEPPMRSRTKTTIRTGFIGCSWSGSSSYS